MSEERDVLDILHEMLENERAFYGIIRFLDGGTRNNIVAAHMRNTSTELALLRQFMTAPATLTLNIPLGAMDTSGSFFDPVPIVPSPAQIEAAVERHIGLHDVTCAICQENVACATRIRACGHSFHNACISEWFSVNSRCPVCRHDVRDLQRGASNVSNAQNSRVHPDS